jgi:heterodisulfide reductase subunit B
MAAEYAFYPGCTLHSTGVEFGISTELVCEVLDLEMVEIDDWNCCGASSAHSMDHTLFLALPARNLAKAQEVELGDGSGSGELSLAIPCAACYSRLAAADLALQEDAAFRAQMEAALDFEYQGRVRPRSLLDIFANDISREALRARVKKPLEGLKVVSYYGCLLIRPPQYTQLWDDPEHPQSMDYVVELMGAEALPWSYGVDCCGGSLTLNRSDVVVHLVDKLARAAHEAGADVHGQRRRATALPGWAAAAAPAQAGLRALTYLLLHGVDGPGLRSASAQGAGQAPGGPPAPAERTGVGMKREGEGAKREARGQQRSRE